MAFQVSGTTAPMMAVVGEGTEPVAMPYPQELTSWSCRAGARRLPPTSPGLPATSMHIALSNMSGTWLGTSRGGDRERVSRTRSIVQGGLPVTLTAAYPTKAGPLGPGSRHAHRRPDQGVPHRDHRRRRGAVGARAEGVARRPAQFEPSDIAETDDGGGGRGGVQRREGRRGHRRPDRPGDRQRSGARTIRSWTRSMARPARHAPSPTPAIVQNGSGAPGVGEARRGRHHPSGVQDHAVSERADLRRGDDGVFANGVDPRGGRHPRPRGAGGRPSAGLPGIIGYRRYHDRRREGLHD